jgi:broad specificity phosphatase PhoE
MNIYFVRHTQVEWDKPYPYFRSPVWLSEQGRAHAKQIGAWFLTHGLTLPIITSPLVRTVQTAELIASSIQSSVRCDDRLLEVDCPYLQTTHNTAYTIENEEDAPTYEGHAAVLARILSLYEERALGEDVILVSHGTPLSLLFRHLAHIAVPNHMWSQKEDPQNNIKKGEILHVSTTEDPTSPTLTRITV